MLDVGHSLRVILMNIHLMYAYPESLPQVTEMQLILDESQRKVKSAEAQYEAARAVLQEAQVSEVGLDFSLSWGPALAVGDLCPALC